VETTLCKSRGGEMGIEKKDPEKEEMGGKRHEKRKERDHERSVGGMEKLRTS